MARDKDVSKSWDERVLAGELPPGVPTQAEYWAKKAKQTGQTGTLGERTTRGANRFELTELRRQLGMRGLVLEEILREKWIDTRIQIMSRIDIDVNEAERVVRDIMASVAPGTRV